MKTFKEHIRHDNTNPDEVNEYGDTIKEVKHFRTTYGWAGGRNEKTGGKYKHPDHTKNMAHEYNLDAAQREIDRRSAEGEDMSNAVIDKKTYKITKPTNKK